MPAGVDLGIADLAPYLTPNDDFYVISKNSSDLSNDRGPDWSIEVDGLVNTPMTLFRADLTALGEEGPLLQESYGTPEAIGELMLEKFLIAFEASSLLLLGRAASAPRRGALARPEPPDR